jgi:hypothetical protein
MKMKIKGSTTNYHLRQEARSGLPPFAAAAAPSGLSSAGVNGITTNNQNGGGEKYKCGD